MEQKDRLNQWMAATQTSPTELADRLGYDYTYIWMIRVGQRDITDSFRWRFAGAYGYEAAVRVLGTNAVVRESGTPGRD
jgi:hypothetical protein